MDDITIVERLSRTLCTIRSVAADDHHPDFGTQWQSVAREAKGLLIALRDPTAQMVDAAVKVSGVKPEAARQIFKVMIEAAIPRQI
jgi:hypothetical protein